MSEEDQAVRNFAGKWMNGLRCQFPAKHCQLPEITNEWNLRGSEIWLVQNNTTSCHLKKWHVSLHMRFIKIGQWIWVLLPVVLKCLLRKRIVIQLKNKFGVWQPSLTTSREWMITWGEIRHWCAWATTSLFREMRSHYSLETVGDWQNSLRACKSAFNV